MCGLGTQGRSACIPVRRRAQRTARGQWDLTAEGDKAHSASQCTSFHLPPSSPRGFPGQSGSPRIHNGPTSLAWAREAQACQTAVSRRVRNPKGVKCPSGPERPGPLRPQSETGDPWPSRHTGTRTGQSEKSEPLLPALPGQPIEGRNGSIFVGRKKSAIHWSSSLLRSSHRAVRLIGPWLSLQILRSPKNQVVAHQTAHNISSMPLSKNQAERAADDVQHKISGTFRRTAGATAFCVIRSSLLAALTAVFEGSPFSLAWEPGT
jgi:hypothetical protein